MHILNNLLTQKQLKMKKVFGLFSMMLMFAAVSIAAPGPGKSGVDINKSKVVWKGYKVTGEHQGVINIKSGNLDFDSKGVLTGGSFEMDMTSITCTDLSGDMAGKLVGHLKSDDFFGVEKFPTSKLVIKSVSKKKGNTYEIKGDLTIKGKSNPITFNADVVGTTAKASLKVDRSLYDVRYGSGKFFENLGDKTIYDNFDLDVELVFTK
jgi:polyisoprenoid-binding protein YceI